MENVMDYEKMRESLIETIGNTATSVFSEVENTESVFAATGEILDRILHGFDVYSRATAEKCHAMQFTGFMNFKEIIEFAEVSLSKVDVVSFPFTQFLSCLSVKGKSNDESYFIYVGDVLVKDSNKGIILLRPNEVSDLYAFSYAEVIATTNPSLV